jgi:hypothetical protein
MKNFEMKWLKYIAGAVGGVIAGIILMFGGVKVVYPAISQLVGLSVAQTATLWNSVADAAKGDALSSGIMAVNCYMWNGLTFDRCRGTITNGLLVEPKTVGTSFYAINRTNITTASVNLAFGFTSRKVKVIASPNNTADVCIDWLGGTAVCPAANTAGDDRLKAGTTLIIDDYAVTSLAVIADTGTQEVQVAAWN